MRWRSGTTRTDGTLYVRSRYYAVWGGPLPLVAAVGSIHAIVTDPEVHTDVWAAGLVAAFVAAAGLALSVRCWRVALVEVPGGVEVRNVFSTRTISWDDVTGIGIAVLPASGYCAALAFRLRERRWRRLASATTTYSRRHADAVCTAVRTRADARGVPFTADAESLRSTVF